MSSRHWALVAAGAAALFAALAADVALGGLVDSIDRRISAWVLGNIDPATRESLFEVRFSVAGDGFWAGACALGLGGVLAWRRWGWAAAYLGAVVATHVIVHAIKAWIARPRPSEGLTSSFAFPSGHTATATLTFTLAALLLVRVYGLPRRWELLGAAAALLLVVVVGLGRVLGGVHYPSDVVGGYLLAWTLCAGVMVFWRLQPRLDAVGEPPASP